jgi:hypothetical protein
MPISYSVAYSKVLCSWPAMDQHSNLPVYNKEHIHNTCAEALYKKDKYMKF